MTCEILCLCVLTKKTIGLFANRRRLWRAMAVPCKERLVLFDFDDEEDDLNVSKNSLSEGIAYPVLGI